MKHKINIKVADRSGQVKSVVSGATMTIPKKIITWLFGDMATIMVLTPGETVEAVEIHEVR